MNVAIDSNLLLRYTQVGDPQHVIALQSMAMLRKNAHRLCILPQNLYEFWVVFTRPKNANGLGRIAAEATTLIGQFRNPFSVYGDVPSIFSEWLRLVTTHNVLGKSAHDARIAAAMGVHGITHILTFNTADFARYPAVTALDPHPVAAGTIP